MNGVTHWLIIFRAKLKFNHAKSIIITSSPWDKSLDDFEEPGIRRLVTLQKFQENINYKNVSWAIINWIHSKP